MARGPSKSRKSYDRVGECHDGADEGDGKDTGVDAPHEEEEEEDDDGAVNLDAQHPPLAAGDATEGTSHRRRRRCTAVALACLCLGGAAAAAVLARTGPAVDLHLGGGAGAGADSDSDAPPANANAHPDSGPPRDSGSCRAAASTPSSVTHAVPVEGSPVSRIAFGSCFIPSYQTSDALWRHVRETFRPDLWIWLGDNMYMDTFSDVDGKRRAYSEAREDVYYRNFGPVAEPKIPVTGMWDDHDFGFDNMGREYPCLASSQAEFVTHFNLPESDPRHPAQGQRQRNGVYSSQMFSRPGAAGGGDGRDAPDGVHVINLDCRSHRSPTYPRLPSASPQAQAYHLKCDGADSTMLGPTQWSWLEDEMLNRRSAVKLVGSGVQVLPPTSRDRPAADYCSYDGPGGTFEAANLDLGEGTDGGWAGTVYEGWGEMPQERRRLLRLAQRSVNSGMARTVVFLTGDQHWAEIQAKRMPPDGDGVYGESRILYSVTASGIDQHYVEDVPNTNRVRVRTADRGGDGVYASECNFPFVKDGIEHDDCADVFGSGVPGCSTGTDPNGVHLAGQWGNCLPEEEELVPRRRSKFGRGNKCTDNYHHTCSARANYGGIVVDWERGTMNITVFTPHEEEEVASSVEIDI